MCKSWPWRNSHVMGGHSPHPGPIGGKDLVCYQENKTWQTWGRKPSAAHRVQCMLDIWAESLASISQSHFYSYPCSSKPKHKVRKFTLDLSLQSEAHEVPWNQEQIMHHAFLLQTCPESAMTVNVHGEEHALLSSTTLVSEQTGTNKWWIPPVLLGLQLVQLWAHS